MKTIRSGALGAVPLPIVGLLVLLLVAVGVRFAAAGGDGVHPSPRGDVTGETVVGPERYAAYPQIAATYRVVAEIPQVVDGLYCYCDCAKHSGHRSLLSCFEDDHGAGCDICLEEAAMAYRMHGAGEDLAAIRASIDAAFGT